MKERPILFSAPMVRAILDGTKTQTRRVVKPQPGPMPKAAAFDRSLLKAAELEDRAQICRRKNWPFGQPGDQLWVRENFIPRQTTGYVEDDFTLHIKYPANGEERHEGQFEVPEDWGFEKTRVYPSIFMPRWASRIQLEVAEVRVQRLNEISTGDVMAEGRWWNEPSPTLHGYTAQERFKELWDSINGKREGAAWAYNPWVWAITFKRIKP